MITLNPSYPPHEVHLPDVHSTHRQLCVAHAHCTPSAPRLVAKPKRYNPHNRGLHISAITVQQPQRYFTTFLSGGPLACPHIQDWLVGSRSSSFSTAPMFHRRGSPDSPAIDRASNSAVAGSAHCTGSPSAPKFDGYLNTVSTRYHLKAMQRQAVDIHGDQQHHQYTGD